MSELVFASATRQLAMLRAGEISISELAEAHLKQIAWLNPEINAFADFDAERVRAQARELEKGWDQSGRSGQSDRSDQWDQWGRSGALYGLPVTVKSSIATAGYKCEIGSTLNRGDIPKEDAPVVARLRAAGALILGTTNCPEFLMAYETDNRLHGRTANPWDLKRTPGGSSGGESAAIAAGMSAAGLGSDSGGSVRLPAHFTGICALKPTPGRIPGRGHLPPCVGPFSTLGAIGPMARTVEDLSLMFSTLSGPDPLDPAGAPAPLRFQDVAELRRTAIGYFEDDGLVPVTAETRQAIQDAVRALREAGFRVEPYRPRALELLRKLWHTFFVQCGAMFYQPAIRGRRSELSPIFQEFLAIAAERTTLTAVALLDAWAQLDLLRSRMLEEMQEFPMLLCPVASVPAFRHGERSWVVEDGCEVGYLDAMRFTQWFNVLGGPAAVVPVGKSAGGLPIGVQIAGRPYEDEAVLGVAGILDKAFGYRPPVKSSVSVSVKWEKQV